MALAKRIRSDLRMESIIAVLLLDEVAFSAAVAIAREAIYLLHHGLRLLDYLIFHPRTDEVTHPHGIITDAMSFSGSWVRAGDGALDRNPGGCAGSILYLRHPASERFPIRWGQADPAHFQLFSFSKDLDKHRIIQAHIKM